MSLQIADPTVPESNRSAAQMRVDSLDGLRGLAALYVVLHHTYKEFVVPGSYYDKWLGFLQYGGFSVALFIMLSGFCLALPVFANDCRLRNGYIGFLKRRARRILPPYYAALLLSMLINYLLYRNVCGPFGTHGLGLSILSHFLLIQNLVGNTDHNCFGDYRINGVMWTVAVEFQIYLLFPLFVAGWRKLNPLWTIALVLSGATFLQCIVTGTLLNGINCVYYGLFVIGMLVAWLAEKYADRMSQIASKLPSLFFAVFILYCWFLHVQGLQWAVSHFPTYNVLTGLVCVILLLGAIFEPKWRSLLERSELIALGGFSYSLYLIHIPLLKFFAIGLIRPVAISYGSLAAFIAMLIIAVPVIIIASQKFSKLIEEPFLSKNAKMSRQTGNSYQNGRA